MFRKMRAGSSSTAFQRKLVLRAKVFYLFLVYFGLQTRASARSTHSVSICQNSQPVQVVFSYDVLESFPGASVKLQLNYTSESEKETFDKIDSTTWCLNTGTPTRSPVPFICGPLDEEDKNKVEDCATRNGFDSNTINQQTCNALGCCFDPTSSPICRNHLPQEEKTRILESQRENGWLSLGRCVDSSGIEVANTAGLTVSNILNVGKEEIKVSLHSNECNSTVEFVVEVNVCDIGYKLNDENLCEPYCSDSSCFCADINFKQNCEVHDCPADTTFDGIHCRDNLELCNLDENRTTDCFWIRNPCAEIEGFRYNGSMCVVPSEANVTCNGQYEYVKEECTAKLWTYAPTNAPTTTPSINPSAGPTLAPTQTTCLPYEKAPPGHPQSCYCGDEKFNKQCPTCQIIPICPSNYFQYDNQCILDIPSCQKLYPSEGINNTEWNSSRLYSPEDCSTNTSVLPGVNETNYELETCKSRCDIGYEYSNIMRMCLPILDPNCFQGYFFDKKDCSVKQCTSLENKTVYENLNILLDESQSRILVNGKVSDTIHTVTIKSNPVLSNGQVVLGSQSKYFGAELMPLDSFYSKIQPGKYNISFMFLGLCNRSFVESREFKVKNTLPVLQTKIDSSGLSPHQIKMLGTNLLEIRVSDEEILFNATVIIDARSSYDPDGAGNITLKWNALNSEDVNQLEWTTDGLPLGVVQVSSMRYGKTTLQLSANDFHGGAIVSNFSIVAVKNKPPSVTLDPFLRTQLTLGRFSEAELNATIVDDGNIQSVKWFLIDTNATTQPYFRYSNKTETRLKNLQANAFYDVMIVVIDDEGLSSNQSVSFHVDNSGKDILSLSLPSAETEPSFPLLYQNSSVLVSWNVNQPYNTDELFFRLYMYATDMNPVMIANYVSGMDTSYMWHIPFIDNMFPTTYQLVLAMFEKNGTPTQYYTSSGNVTIRSPVNYFSGDYETCSEECTISFTSRKLSCVNNFGATIPIGICDWVYGMFNRPETRRRCFYNTKHCIQSSIPTRLTQYGSWDLCSYNGNVTNICESPSAEAGNSGAFESSRSVSCYSVSPQYLDTETVVGETSCEGFGEISASRPCSIQETCESTKFRYEYVSSMDDEDNRKCVCPIDDNDFSLSIKCLDTISGLPVLESNCINNNVSRPTQAQKCELEMASCHSLSWRIGRWNLDSKDSTFYRREVRCYDELSKTFVSDSTCSHIGIKPKSSRIQSNIDNTFHSVWVASKWSGCLFHSCEMTRTVECVNLINPYEQGNCSHVLKPDNISICDDMDQQYCMQPSFRNPADVQLLTNESNCKEGALVQVDGICCSAPSIQIDKNGLCCEAGAVDACGVCNGKSVVDLNGNCCTGTLDANGHCCPENLFVDDCGVCGGLGLSCSFDAHLRLENISQHLVESLSPSHLFSYYRQNMAKLLKQDLQLGTESLLQILPNTVKIHSKENRSMTNSADSSISLIVRISPQSDTDSLWSYQTYYSVLSQLDSKVRRRLSPRALSSNVLFGYSVDEYTRTGVCGNGFCEIGEFEITDTQHLITCKQDCGQTIGKTCPRSLTGEVCGGHGTCMMNSGNCKCFTAQGFGGTDCSTCLSGWIKVKNDCIPYNSTIPVPTFNPTISLANLPEALSASNWLDLYWKHLVIGVCSALGFMFCCLMCTIIVYVKKSRKPTVTVVNPHIPMETCKPGFDFDEDQELGIGDKALPSTQEEEIGIKIESPRKNRQHGVTFEGWLRKRVNGKWDEKRYYVLYKKTSKLTFYSGMSESSNHYIYVGELGSICLNNLSYVRSEPKENKYKERVFQIGVSLNNQFRSNQDPVVSVLEFMAKTKEERQIWVESLSFYISKFQSRGRNTGQMKGVNKININVLENDEVPEVDSDENSDSEPEIIEKRKKSKPRRSSSVHVSEENRRERRSKSFNTTDEHRRLRKGSPSIKHHRRQRNLSNNW